MMDNENKFWLGISTLVIFVILVIILVLGGNIYKNNYLISQQPTCYGKVLQTSWNNPSDLILALHNCDGK